MPPINGQQETGLSREQISSSLAKTGLSREQINSAWAKVDTTKTQALVPPAPTFQTKFDTSIPDKVPSSVLSSGTTFQSNNNLQKQFQQTMEQQKALQEQALALRQQTPEELQAVTRANELRDKLRTFDTSTIKGTLGEEGQGRGITLDTIRQRQSEFGREREFERMGLSSELQAVTDNLNALVSARQTQVDGLSTALDFNQSNFDMLQNLSKLTQPEVLQTQIDKQTGEIVGIIRDPSTGAIEQRILGSITPEKAPAFNPNGTFTNAQGQVVAWGTNAQGQIETQVLGNAQPKEVSGKGGATSGMVGTGGLSVSAQRLLSNPSMADAMTPSEYNASANELFANGYDIPRKLTASQREAQQSAVSAINALSNLKQNIFDANGELRKAVLVGAMTGIGSTATYRREVIDVISRIRTGAALTSSEEAFYAKQAPNITDTTSSAKKKIEQLASFYSGISGTPVVLRSPNGELFEYNDMYNTETRLEVRNALQNNYELVGF